MMKAFCDRNGVIEFGPFVPDGHLPIATSADGIRLRETIEGACRHAYDGKTLLVPGIPEADSDDAALDALLAFNRGIQERLHRKLERI
jgi:hypothetical protein